MIQEEHRKRFTDWKNYPLRICRPPWEHNGSINPQYGTLVEWDDINTRLAMMLEDLIVQKIKDKRRLRRTLRGNLGLDPSFPQKYWPSEIVILDFELIYGEDYLYGDRVQNGKQEVCVYCPLRGLHTLTYIDRIAATNEQLLMCTLYFMWKYDHPFIKESLGNAKLYLELGV